MNFKLFIKSILFILIAFGCKKSKIEKGEFNGTLNGAKWKPNVQTGGADAGSCFELFFQNYEKGIHDITGWVKFPSEIGKYDFWDGEELSICLHSGSPVIYYLNPFDSDLLLSALFLDTLRAEVEGAFIDVSDINEEFIEGELYLPLKRNVIEAGTEVDEFGNPNRILIEGEWKVYLPE